MYKIRAKMPRLNRLSQYVRIVESVKSSVKRIGGGVAEVVRDNCPPDRLVIHGEFAGHSLRKDIDASPAFMDGKNLFCGIGDERKMVPWWEAVERGMAAKKGWHFVGTEINPKLSGKGKHGEGFMVKGGKSKRRLPQRMFAKTYRTQKAPVLFKLNSALRKAFK